MQLEYKMKRMIGEKIHEKEEVLKMRLEHLRAIEKDREAAQRVIQKRLDFASGLKDAVVKKDDSSQAAAVPAFSLILD